MKQELYRDRNGQIWVTEGYAMNLSNGKKMVRLINMEDGTSAVVNEAEFNEVVNKNKNIRKYVKVS